MAYISKKEIIDRAEARGSHYFEPGTLRFFKARLAQSGFIGSEGVATLVQSMPEGFTGPRRYFVAVPLPDGSTLTHRDADGPVSWVSRSAAHRAAAKLAK